MGMESLAGQVFGQYELKELAGVGGMGAVYRAYQASLDRDVAVKILSVALGTEPDYLERFTREAKTAAALEHPNIVPIYDYGTQDNLNYVVMRYLSGGTLAQRLHRQRNGEEPLTSLEEISALLKGLADALDYAHAQGVIHRDIKPSNIMFDNRANVSLVDFGIAKLMQNAAALTGTGVSMGTPLYMSPEQWRAEPPSPSTDQYAMGVVVYILVTGQPPFEAPTPYGLMHRHLNDTPTPPQVLRPGVPGAISQVLLRAMAKTSAERFPTVTAFAQAFEAALEKPISGRTDLFSAMSETESSSDQAQGQPVGDTTNVAFPPAFIPPSPAMQAVTPPPPAHEVGGIVLPQIGTPPEGQSVPQQTQYSAQQPDMPVQQQQGTPAPGQPIPQPPMQQPQYPAQQPGMPDQQQQGTPAPGQPIPQPPVQPQYPVQQPGMPDQQQQGTPAPGQPIPQQPVQPQYPAQQPGMPDQQQQGTPAPGQPIPQPPMQQPQYPVQQSGMPDQQQGTPPPGQPIPQQPMQPQYPAQPPQYPVQQPVQPQYPAQQPGMPDQQQQGTPAPGQPIPQPPMQPQYPAQQPGMPDQQQGTPPPGQPIPQQPVQPQYPPQYPVQQPVQPQYPAQQPGMPDQQQGTPPPGQPIPQQPMQPQYPAQPPQYPVQQPQYSAEQMNIPALQPLPQQYPQVATGTYPPAAAPHQQAALWFLVGTGLLIVLGALVIIVLALAGVGPFEREEKITVVTPVPITEPAAQGTEAVPTADVTDSAVEGTDEPMRLDGPHAEAVHPAQT